MYDSEGTGLVVRFRQIWSEQELAEWWQWFEKLQRSGLGFPGDYDIGKPRGKTPASSIVPKHIIVPRHLRAIDKAIARMPKPHIKVLEFKFTTPGKNDQEIALRCGIPYSTYKVKLSNCYSWLNGYFSGSCKF